MNVQLSANGSLNGKELWLEFSLSDPENCVEGSLTPGNWKGNALVRAHDLWRKTCFEAFFSPPQAKEYWEINISPQGQWNLYQFGEYRSPQPPTESQELRLLELETTKNSLRAKLEGNTFFPALDFSFCAVLKIENSSHYYSTNHAGKKPDFHLRESFQLRRSNEARP